RGCTQNSQLLLPVVCRSAFTKLQKVSNFGENEAEAKPKKESLKVRYEANPIFSSLPKRFCISPIERFEVLILLNFSLSRVIAKMKTFPLRRFRYKCSELCLNCDLNSGDSSCANDVMNALRSA